LTRIGDLFAQRIREVNSQIEAATPNWARQWLLENTPDAINQAMAQADTERFIHTGTQIRLAVKYTLDDGNPTTERLHLSTGYAFPYDPNWDSWHNNMQLSPKSTIYKEVTAKLLERQRILREQSDLHKHIQTLFQHCSTLKQLVEVWPSCLDFVPPHTKQQYYAPNPPRKKKVDLEALKTPDFTVAMTKAKMLAKDS